MTSISERKPRRAPVTLRRPGRAAALALTLLMPPVLGRAAAAEPAPAAPAASDEGKRHFEQGVALYNDGDYATALAEFSASYQAAPLPAVLYNIGVAQKALFRYAEAIDTLQRYLAEAQPRAERRAEVERLCTEMEALLAPVTLRVSPADATLVVDGRAAGSAPQRPLRLAAGAHVIEASAEGHRPLRREIMVSAGRPLTLTLALAELPRAGKVLLRSNVPSAVVKLDGKPVGGAPVDLELKEGGYLLEVAAPGWQTFRGEIVVAAGQQRVLLVPLERRERLYQKWWFWTLTAVAAGGVAAAIALPLSTKTQPPLPGTLDPFTIKTN